MAAQIPLILDVDTGIDDALMVAWAATREDVELLAVSTLSGNVDAVKATENTRRVLGLVGAGHVPVHRGATRPLARAPRYATDYHGDNGIGDADLPAVTMPLGPDRGPAAIIRHATQRPGEITVVATGPLTNLAIALNVCPELPSLIKRVVVMGGAFRAPGNRTPYAEFNILADPEAASQVLTTRFHEGLVVGLDVTHQTLLRKSEWEHFGQSGNNALATLLYSVCKRSFTVRNMQTFPLHDPVTMASALDPSLVTTERGQIDVVLEGEREGQTIFTADPAGSWQVAFGVDADRFVAEFLASYQING